MEVITYSLRDDQTRSDGYYLAVAAFTDTVIAEGEARLAQPLGAFQAYLSQTAREQLRTTPEYVLEFLTLGVLWKVYAGRSGGLPPVTRQALIGLVSLRKKNARLKPIVDGLRGALNGLFLWSSNPDGAASPNTIQSLDYLLRWLSASGDFPQELLRLSAWRDFLQTRSPAEAAVFLAAARSFADWFQQASLEKLGRYTPNVERFVARSRPLYRWRRDAVLCGRQRIEYHLNMVGTEILNRAFREAFLKAERKVLFLPPCMKAKPDAECQAASTPVGERCAACTPACRVNQLTKLGEKHGFQVFMLPDDLSTLIQRLGQIRHRPTDRCRWRFLRADQHQRRLGDPSAGHPRPGRAAGLLRLLLPLAQAGYSHRYQPSPPAASHGQTVDGIGDPASGSMTPSLLVLSGTDAGLPVGRRPPARIKAPFRLTRPQDTFNNKLRAGFRKFQNFGSLEFFSPLQKISVNSVTQWFALIYSSREKSVASV